MRKLSLMLMLCMILVAAISLSGCATYDFGDTGNIIVTAKEALVLIKDSKTVLVDMQDESDYSLKHIENAVNIPRNAINVDNPFSNMLAPKDVVEKVMGSKGISNESLVLVYDNINNMDASRLWWTLLVYGHENVKIVSGGLKALQNEGLQCTDTATNVNEVEFIASDLNEKYIAYKSDVEKQVNVPDENIMLIDTRSKEEFDLGTIPSSVNIDYIGNNYSDGTFKSVRDIQIMYLEKGLKPEMSTILYCKTSIRGAETFAALWNAGYRNIKLYDGAWIEWSSDKDAPSDTPADSSTPVKSSGQDNS